MQYEGRADLRPPLIAIHRGEDALQLVSAPAEVQARMRNYCGSVCADAGDRWFAVSSPRGNLVTLWTTAGGRFQDSVEVKDGCGLAPDAADGGITITSGAGAVLSYQVGGGATRALELDGRMGARWENHLAFYATPEPKKGAGERVA